MVDKSSNIKERVLQIAKYKGISKEKFIENIGMTYGNFKGKSKKTPLNSNAIEDILTKYPEINPEWLLIGTGNMLKDDVSKIDNIYSLEKRFENSLDAYVQKTREHIQLLEDHIELLKKVNNSSEDKIASLTQEVEKLKKEKSINIDPDVVGPSEELKN